MRKFMVLAGKLFKVYGFQMKIRGAGQSVNRCIMRVQARFDYYERVYLSQGSNMV